VELYNDAALNALEEQVSVSNQNVQQAEAQYREAKAAVSVSRAALSPTVTATPAATLGGSGTTSGASGSDEVQPAVQRRVGTIYGEHPPALRPAPPPPSLWRPMWPMPVAIPGRTGARLLRSSRQ